jgi:hypothetical protein
MMSVVIFESARLAKNEAADARTRRNRRNGRARPGNIFPARATSPAVHTAPAAM